MNTTVDDGCNTISFFEAHKVDEDVNRILRPCLGGDVSRTVWERLCVDNHASYLLKALERKPVRFTLMDPSKPWVAYWATHGLDLIDKAQDLEASHENIIRFLAACQHSGGGFCGGPGQSPHLAPTYASVATLVSIGTEKALSVINRKRLRDFLLRCCTNFGIKVSEYGEVDVRACYLALAAAHMAGLSKDEIATRSDAVNFITRCQTYEGGFGGEPGNEAHGGYTYCAVAALSLINAVAAATDIPRLASWLSQRQCPSVGGFNGRTNKLADACYSFWVPSVFSMISNDGNGQTCDEAVQSDRSVDAAADTGHEEPSKEASANLHLEVTVTPRTGSQLKGSQAGSFFAKIAQNEKTFFLLCRTVRRFTFFLEYGLQVG